MDFMSSFKFMNRGSDGDRTSDERLRKPPLPSRLTTPPGPSPTSIRTASSTKSRSSYHPHQPPPSSPRFTLAPPSPPFLENTDTLPTSHAALEGHLNHHASQLQQLADRVEMLNEWIELDGIVLGRLVRDEGRRVEEGFTAMKKENNAEPPRRNVQFELGPRDAHVVGLKRMSLVEKGKRSASLGDVPKIPASSLSRSSSMMMGKRKEEVLACHQGVREVRERIAEMKRWRKEVEKAVVWQREEYWRVEKAMGKKKEEGKRESVLTLKENEKVTEGTDNGKENRGAANRDGEEDGGSTLVSGRTKSMSIVGGLSPPSRGERGRWSKADKEGRLPSQREWEVMFSHSAD
ncbi:MAG: hypothetical protein Q9166_007864 [cf. Caloplaca sp. 2 TL-2023]